MSAAQEWRQGWRAVVGAGIGVATGLALFAYIASLFIPEYQKAFQWTRAEIGLQAWATMAAGFTAPFIGRIADRIGIRMPILVCTLGFGAVCVAMANQTGDIGLYWVLYFLLVLFGLGAGSGTWTRAITAVFDKARGFALSVALSLVSLTAIVMPIFLETTIAQHGWRAGWYLVGAVGVGFGLLALLILPRQTAAPVRVGGVASLAQAARMPGFWLAVIGMFLINIPSGGVMNQMAPLIKDKGFDGGDAALMMAAFAAAVFVGRLIAGVCLDRFPTRYVAFVAMAAPAVGCVLLIDQAGIMLGVVLAGLMLTGLSQGAEGDIGPYLIARRFGMAAFAGMSGALSGAVVVGTAAGTFLFSQMHTRTGSYDGALWIGAGAFLLGALCYLAIDSRPEEERTNARAATSQSECSAQIAAAPRNATSGSVINRTGTGAT